MNLRCLLACLALLLSAAAAPPCVPWTNQDVLQLVRSGLSAGVVSARLRTVACVRFDLSVDALQMMQKQGIPPSVLIAMIEVQKRQDEAGDTSKATATRPASAPDPPWTSAQLDRAGQRALLSFEAWDENGTPLPSGHGVWVSSAGLILGFGFLDARVHSLRIRSREGDVFDHAALVETDARRSLSVLRVNTSGMPALAVDSSDSLPAGTPAVAIQAVTGADDLLSAVTEAPVDASLVPGAGSGYHLIPLQIDGLHSPAPIAGRPLLSRHGALIGIISPWLWHGELVAIPAEEFRGLLRDRLGRMLTSAWPVFPPAPVAAPPANPLQRMRRAHSVFVDDRTRSGLDARADEELRKAGPWQVLDAAAPSDLWLEITATGKGWRRSETLEVFDRPSRALLWSRSRRVLPMRRSAIRDLVDALIATVDQKH